MIFSDIELVKKILDGSKTTTIRLKKENEAFVLTTDKKSLKEYNLGEKVSNPDPQTWNEVWTAKGKVKWRVGSDYSCQLKRGGKGVNWCTKCKNLMGIRTRNKITIFAAIDIPLDHVKVILDCDCNKQEFVCRTKKEYLELQKKVSKGLFDWQSLRLRVTFIEERDLDSISEDEAKQDGFESRRKFMEYFLKVNWQKIPKKIRYWDERVYSETKQEVIPKFSKFHWHQIVETWNPKVWRLTLSVKGGN